MFTRSLNLRSILAAAALSMAAAAAPGGLGVGMPGSSVVAPRRNASKRQRRYGDGGLRASHSYPNGPGWGIAKVKRMAKKKRNVIKNRRNHRG